MTPTDFAEEFDRTFSDLTRSISLPFGHSVQHMIERIVLTSARTQAFVLFSMLGLYL